MFSHKKGHGQATPKGLDVVDLSLEIPNGFLKVLLARTLVVCSCDVFHSVAEVVVELLGFDEVNGLNAPYLVMGRVVHHVCLGLDHGNGHIC